MSVTRLTTPSAMTVPGTRPSTVRVGVARAAAWSAARVPAGYMPSALRLAGVGRAAVEDLAVQADQLRGERVVGHRQLDDAVGAERLGRRRVQRPDRVRLRAGHAADQRHGPVRV